MSLVMRWAGAGDLERVAQTRMCCFGGASGELERFKKLLIDEKEAQVGDYLLAERDGVAVGTATSMTFNMWMRGAPFTCQGVAWVGALKTERRRMGTGGDKVKQVGVASECVRELLRKARERENVISALMPFRASYYDHFGYGLVERRNLWTVPMSILPSGSTDSMRFYTPADLPAVQACRQRMVEAGQCDLERTGDRWDSYMEKFKDGFVVVDPEPNGTIRGWMAFKNAWQGTLDIVDVTDQFYDDVEALKRQLNFLGALKDQYFSAKMLMPPDMQLNRLLREPQLPHRPVNHAHSDCAGTTRMQIRILDHKKFLERLKLPGDARGKAVVAVHETEGTISKFAVDIEGGRVSYCASNQSADIELTDKAWASVVSGDISATTARQIGIIQGTSDAAVATLDHFARGPLPYCRYAF